MIKATFRVDSVMDFVNGKVNRTMNSVMETLAYVGQACVSQAKERGRYQNRTGNLRNSLGYVVLKNGIVQHKDALNEKSSHFMEELIPAYKNGIVLLVVAGMKYASFVEAKNLDVLSSGELLAESLMPEMLKQLGFEL